jgi:hypothetical protein
VAASGDAHHGNMGAMGLGIMRMLQPCQGVCCCDGGAVQLQVAVTTMLQVMAWQHCTAQRRGTHIKGACCCDVGAMGPHITMMWWQIGGVWWVVARMRPQSHHHNHSLKLNKNLKKNQKQSKERRKKEKVLTMNVPERGGEVG